MDYKQALFIRDNFTQLLTETLTSEDVETALEAIRVIGVEDGDDEMAHVMEKQLWEKILTQASNNGNELATLALKSKDIEFSRWFA